MNTQELVVRAICKAYVLCRCLISLSLIALAYGLLRSRIVYDVLLLSVMSVDISPSTMLSKPSVEDWVCLFVCFHFWYDEILKLDTEASSPLITTPQ
jgi:hypothetical protein